MSAWNYTLSRFSIAMINFVIVAVMGCILRYFFYQPFEGLIYPHMLHAHSHLAFLGWVFIALYSLLIYAFLPKEAVKAKKYSALFILFQVANLGMILTFPITGYALWSIIFSSIHAIGSMAFVWFFIREASRNLNPGQQMAFTFVKWSLILMFISNLAPFALGPVTIRGMGQSDLYYMLIYFYLHFQYNGWFTFAVMGLLLWYFRRKGIETNKPVVKWIFWLKLISIFPAYILSALYLKPAIGWYMVGGISGSIQLLAIVLFLSFIFKNINSVTARMNQGIILLFFFGLLGLSLQHLLQFMSAFPVLAGVAFARNIVIAYLHMVLIGFISIFLLFFANEAGFFRLKRVRDTGLIMFLVGFVLTEVVLLFQPHLSNSPVLLFGLAVLQFFGVLTMLFSMQLPVRLVV